MEDKSSKKFYGFLVAGIIVVTGLLVYFLIRPVNLSDDAPTKTPRTSSRSNNSKTLDLKNQTNKYQNTQDKKNNHETEQSEEYKIPEKYLGRVKVKVVDKNGNPVPNAGLAYGNFEMKGGAGTYFRGTENVGNLLQRGPRKTDPNGEAIIRVRVDEEVKNHLDAGYVMVIQAFKAGYVVDLDGSFGKNAVVKPERHKTKKAKIVLKRGRKLNAKILGLSKKERRHLNEKYKIVLYTPRKTKGSVAFPNSKFRAYKRSLKINKKGGLVPNNRTFNPPGDKNGIYAPLEKLILFIGPRAADLNHPEIYKDNIDKSKGFISENKNIKSKYIMDKAPDHSEMFQYYVNEIPATGRPEPIDLDIQLKENPDYGVSRLKLTFTHPDKTKDDLDIVCLLYDEQREKIVSWENIFFNPGVTSPSLKKELQPTSRLQIWALAQVPGKKKWFFWKRSIGPLENGDTTKVTLSEPKQPGIVVVSLLNADTGDRMPEDKMDAEDPINGYYRYIGGKKIAFYKEFSKLIMELKNNKILVPLFPGNTNFEKKSTDNVMGPDHIFLREGEKKTVRFRAKIE